jgi:hypothetical protein
MRKAARWVMRALAAIGFLFVFATALPLDNWWINWLRGPWKDVKGDVLVVLAADSVKGGSSHGEVPAAEGMRDFMVSQGIPASAIAVQGDSHSTRENALKSKALLEKLHSRKVLLTSDYHIFRAARVFRKAGIEITPRPLPDAATEIAALAKSMTGISGTMRRNSQDRILFRA